MNQQHANGKTIAPQAPSTPLLQQAIEKRIAELTRAKQDTEVQLSMIITMLAEFKALLSPPPSSDESPATQN